MFFMFSVQESLGVFLKADYNLQFAIWAADGGSDDKCL